jgi:hypothetical protein
MIVYGIYSSVTTGRKKLLLLSVPKNNRSKKKSLKKTSPTFGVLLPRNAKRGKIFLKMKQGLEE